MTERNFLIELGTEELPPKALRTLAGNFAANFEAELKAADLAHNGIEWFAAPRRLALKVNALAENQPDKIVEKRGRLSLLLLMLTVTQQKQHKAGLVVMVLL